MKLSPPTSEFLAELTERARRYGWEGDYIEIYDFLKSLYADAGIELTYPCPSQFMPYEICKMCDKGEYECECKK